MNADTSGSLLKDPAFLQQKLQQEERTFETELEEMKEDLSRERSRYRQLETKLEEFEAQAERNASRRLDDAMHENELLREDLENERTRVQDLQKILQELGQFAGERVQLTRRLEIVEEDNKRLEKELADLREKALADQAEISADAYISEETAVKRAIEETSKMMDANVSEETKLLREQNIALQRGILALKKVKGIDFEAKQQKEEENKFDQLVYVDIEHRLSEKNEKIKRLEEENAALLERVAVEKEQVQQFFKKLTEKYEDERTAFKQEVRSLEKLVYVKCKELYKLRTLCALILQKRTDLERILYECMKETVPLGASAQFLDKEYPKTMKEMQRSLIEGIRVVPTLAVEEMGAEKLVEVVSSWIREIDGEDV